MTFYEKYVALCNERGLDPSPAAVQAGIAKSAVTKWKFSPEIIPSNRTLFKLCSFFHVDQDYFFEDHCEDDLVLHGLSEEDKLLIRLLLSAPDDVRASIKLLLQRAL